LISKEAYIEWTPTRLADPRSAKVEQFIHGMEQIIATEGPVMGLPGIPDFLQGRRIEPNLW